jgi:hypothetical protein
VQATQDFNSKNKNLGCIAPGLKPIQSNKVLADLSDQINFSIPGIKK